MVGMTKELAQTPSSKDAETTPRIAFPEIVRETTNGGQVIWFNSAPKEKPLPKPDPKTQDKPLP